MAAAAYDRYKRFRRLESSSGVAGSDAVQPCRIADLEALQDGSRARDRAQKMIFIEF